MVPPWGRALRPTPSRYAAGAAIAGVRELVFPSCGVMFCFYVQIRHKQELEECKARHFHETKELLDRYSSTLSKLSTLESRSISTPTRTLG